MTLDYEVDIAFGFAEAKELMNNDYFLAFVDLCLPDAPNGEVVDYVIEKKISLLFLRLVVIRLLKKNLWIKIY